MQQKGYNDAVTSNANSMAERFAFNGKENNPELGLEFYDFGARNYDAALGRWMNLDPLAENYYYDSPYVFTTNNPVLFIDPDGRFWKKNGDGTWTAEAGDSASSLAQQANISFEEANKHVQAQHGKNYVDPNDGVEKSDLEIGDVVAIPLLALVCDGCRQE